MNWSIPYDNVAVNNRRQLNELRGLFFATAFFCQDFSATITARIGAGYPSMVNCG